MDMHMQIIVSKAMNRIESLYHETNGACYLSFSGGKDSTVVLAIIKLCEEFGTIPKNSIPAVFCDTKIELEATKDFVKWCSENWYGNIQIIRPEKSFSDVLSECGKPIKSKMKSELISRYQKNPNLKSVRMLFDKGYKSTTIADKDMHLLHPNFPIKISNACCQTLKKDPFMKYSKENHIKGYFTGERLAEGGARAVQIKKKMNAGQKICTKIKGNYTVRLPIVDWTDEEIDSFIDGFSVPLSKAYTEYGYTRTGCFCCPFNKNLEADLRILHDVEPGRYKAALFYLKDVYIAQNISLPFDEEYETERIYTWRHDYERMRLEMLSKYRPNCRIVKNSMKED